MTNLEIISIVLRSLAIVAVYGIVGFGSGFVTGIVLANTILARGKPNIMEDFDEAKKLAAQHNAQWNPSHERWSGAIPPSITQIDKPET